MPDVSAGADDVPDAPVDGICAHVSADTAAAASSDIQTDTSPHASANASADAQPADAQPAAPAGATIDTPADEPADGPPAPPRCICRFHALVTLGSPLGCFLSVRGTTLGRSFELRPCQSTIFNVFARNDPVAYRLEPLLMEDVDTADADGTDGQGAGGEGDEEMELPPPVYVPFAGAKTGKRLHIKLRQAWNTQLHEISDTVSRSKQNLYSLATSVHGSLSSSSWSSWLGGKAPAKSLTYSGEDGPEGTTEGAAGEESARPDGASQSAPHAARRTVRWAINQGARVDYVLQESELEAAHEYLAALKAHNSYFVSADVAAFLVHEVVGGVHDES